jgi:hypothetical protein
MDMMPSASFWNPPAEVRRVPDCVRERPCILKTAEMQLLFGTPTPIEETGQHENGDPPRTRTVPVRATFANTLSTAASTAASGSSVIGPQYEAMFTAFPRLAVQHVLDVPLGGAETTAITETLTPLKSRFNYYDTEVVRDSVTLLAKRRNH